MPIFFQPRDIAEVWFWKFGTLFRVSQQPSRRTSISGSNRAHDHFFGRSIHAQEPDITVRCFSRTRTPLIQFLAYARHEYYKGFRVRLYCRVFTYNLHRWKASTLSAGRSLDTIFIPVDTRQKLLADVKEFFASQNWYSSRGIPWRRGIMFSGPPGNGKTSTIQAIASAFDLPIYILPLASRHFRHYELSAAIDQLAGKCIVVLEDFDALMLNVSQRTPEGTGSDAGHAQIRLSLSAILNVLDGISSGEGRLVIATTNHLVFLQLDEALLRPGRFDLFIEFRNANRQQAKELFQHFYKDYCSQLNLLEKELSHEGEIQERLRLGSVEVMKGAELFSELITNEEFSVAALQGHLLAYKGSPKLAVLNLPKLIWKGRRARIMRKAQEAMARSSRDSALHSMYVGERFERASLPLDGARFRRRRRSL